jgi:hypothetical protein
MLPVVYPVFRVTLIVAVLVRLQKGKITPPIMEAVDSVTV